MAPVLIRRSPPRPGGDRMEGDRIDELVNQIARLMRQRGYLRQNIVSALLLRHLPVDAGYAWQGEVALRAKLVKAALDRTTIDHLIASVRTELVTIQNRDRC